MKLIAALFLLLVCCVSCSDDNNGAPYRVTGKITSQGNPISGVTVTLNGATAVSTTTDGAGVYRFSGLKGGLYSVNPAKAGFRFTPSARPVDVSSDDKVGIDFTVGAAPPPTAIQLPKTGQIIGYSPGDDGYLQKGVAWPYLRFIDNGDGTITDILTGLVWFQDAACLGKKQWLDALAAAGGLAGGACGLSDNSKPGDWRLPNINELNSLVHVNRWNPAVPSQRLGSADGPFSGVEKYGYWSSTTFAAHTYQAWIVHFLFGQLEPFSKKSALYVWPVRDSGGTIGTVQLAGTGQTLSYAVGDDGYRQKGAPWPTPRFTDNGNGSVTDNLTKLVWLKEMNCLQTVGGISIQRPNTYSSIRYPLALTWVSKLATGSCGLTDGSQAGEWRLPNRFEAQSLVDYSRSSPGLPANHPFSNVQPQGAWSNTVLNYFITGFAGGNNWFIYPESGRVNVTASGTNVGGGYYIWAVRDGAP
jgi:Protein of unknown function (DUF1566)/Carboxypeptidase regulatory-like domain